MYLILLTVHLKMVHMINFTFYVYHHIKIFKGEKYNNIPDMEDANFKSILSLEVTCS